MNRIATICLFFLAYCSASAQSSGSKFSLLHANNRGRKLQRDLLAAQAGRQGLQKTTALKSRLIAVTTYSTVGLEDTIHYFYSGYRGSKTTIQPAYLLNYFLLPPDGHPMVSADSELCWNSNVLPHAFGFDHKAVSQFDASDRVISRSFHRYHGYKQYYKDDYSYNAAGLNSEDLYADTLNVPGGTMTPKRKTYFRYNSQNKITYDSTWDLTALSPMFKTHYFYDGNGNQVMSKYYLWNSSHSGWEIADSIIQRYNTANLLTNYVYYEFNNGAVDYAYRDTFGYTNSQPLYTYLEDEEMNTINVWDKYYLEQNHLVAAGNDYDSTKESMYDAAQGAYIPDNKTYALFNTDGSLHEVHIFTWNGGATPQPNSIRYYYYEQYNNPNSAPSFVNAPDISVSPNPTGDKGCNLDLIHYPGSAKFSIHLVNSIGQQLYAQSCTGGKVVTMDLQGVPSGMYMLWLENSERKVVYKGKVEKL